MKTVHIYAFQTMEQQRTWYQHLHAIGERWIDTALPLAHMPVWAPRPREDIIRDVFEPGYHECRLVTGDQDLLNNLLNLEADSKESETPRIQCVVYLPTPAGSSQSGVYHLGPQGYPVNKVDDGPLWPFGWLGSHTELEDLQ